jgi:uncharacterized protein (TIGR04141 family)
MPRRKNNEPKIRTFTIFLLKDSHAASPLKPDVTVSEYPVKHENAQIGTLYVQPSHDHPPAWLSFFSGSVPDFAERIVNANTAALYVTAIGGRTFAVAFGYGRHLLAPGSWEEDFGLRVTLNSVDASRIRSVDRMSLDAIGQHSQIQASREANISEFGLDLDQDLLRAVTGPPSGPGLGERLTGKDGLQISIGVDLAGLSGVLEKLLVQWQSNAYKEAFPWLDQIKEVRDASKRDELDALVLARIKQPEANRLWLTVPQLIDWSSVAGFKYRVARSAEIYPDVHLKTFKDECTNVDNLTVDDLKTRHIFAVSHENDNVIDSWAVYRCLYAEVDQGQDTYLLTTGRWYKVGHQFLENVNAAVAAIPQSSLQLPNYHDKSETEYNARVKEESPTVYALMDEKFIRMGGRDKVEFCDLFTHSKKVIHVKRYTGSSAPLSHLFAQAIVSGTLFRREPEFRNKVNAELPAPYRPVTPAPAAGEYEIVLGIISQSFGALVLPFFSRINLKNTYERLQDLGYGVSILKIQAVEAADDSHVHDQDTN